MSEAIVRVPSPAETEYAYYLHQVEHRQQRVAELQTEVEALKLALDRFEAECQARVGDLLTELKRVRDSIAAYEARLRHLDDTEDGGPSWAAPDTDAAFGGRDRTGDDGPDGPAEGTARPEAARVTLAPTAEAAAKRLYLDLAKRYHPDLARSDDARHRREAIMRQVNVAFHSRDLNRLRAIRRQAELDSPLLEDGPIAVRLSWAVREVARLDAVIADLAAQFADLRASKTHRLWRRRASVDDLIEGLRDDLEARLGREWNRLDRLVAAYQQAQERRRRLAPEPSSTTAD